MYLLKRFTPIIAFVASVFLGQLAVSSIGSDSGFWVVLYGLAPLVYQLILLPKRVLKAKFWGLGLPMWLFGVGSVCVLLYVPGALWQQVTVFITSAFIAVYLETEFSYIFQTSKYVPFSLERMGEILLAAGAGMTLMGIIGLDFLGLVKTSWSVLLAAIWAIMTSTGAIYLYRLPKDKLRFLFIFSCVCLFQIYWVLQFLPITFVVSGSIAGILIASLFTLLRYAALESLDKKTLLRTVTTGGTAVLILLITTRWQ